MKKNLILVILILFVVNINAGDMGNTLLTDMILGTSIFSAFGTLLSLPSYIEGGNQNLKVLYVGASYGALIGAGLGFFYGIYDIIRNIQEKKDLQKKVNMLYIYDNLAIKFDIFELEILKKF